MSQTKPDKQEQTYQYQPLTVIGLEEMILPQNSTFFSKFLLLYKWIYVEVV